MGSPYNSTNPLVAQEEKLDNEIRKKFTPLRRDAERVSEAFYRLKKSARGFRVGDCGTLLGFARADDGFKLHTANFCRDRLCPMCNERRSLKIFAQASRIMDYLEDNGKYRYIFLTLTVKNCQSEGLSNAVGKIYAAWTALTRKRNKAWWNAVLGSMRTLEITRNPIDGTWHPHLHCILALSTVYFKRASGLYITQEAFSLMWGKALGVDYKPIVDVRIVKQNNRGGILNELAGKDNKVSRVDDVKGAARYATKALDFLGPAPEVDYDGQVLNEDKVYTDIQIDDNVRTLAKALAGRRLVGWTGVFREARRALALDDAEAGDTDMNDSMRDDIAEQLIIYRWRAGIYVKD